MIPSIHLYAAVVAASTSLVSAHIAFWTDAMWGFNITDTNRPQDPLMNLPFDQWWFHGHLAYPPHPNDIMQLPAGGAAQSQLSCDKDATTYWPSGPGGNQMSTSQPDYPCPGAPLSEFHTTGIEDVGGCALAVAYKSDASEVKPEDFVIFSVNQTCVWYMHTDFQVPADMPPCPNGKCICAWFWLHEPDSGSEQMYMNAFQCNFTNTTSTKTLGPPQVARRCGPEAANNYTWNYSNCTYGPKQPFYWLQQDGNNFFQGYYDSPDYKIRYNFLDGPQNDIFVGTYNTTPPYPSGPGSNQTSSPSPSQGIPTSSPLGKSDPATQTPSASGGGSSTPSGTSSPHPTSSGNMLVASDPSGSNSSVPSGTSSSTSGTASWSGSWTSSGTAMPSPPASNSPDSGTPSPTGTSAADDGNDDDPCTDSGSDMNMPTPTMSMPSGSGMNMPTPPSNSPDTATPYPTSTSAADDGNDDDPCSDSGSGMNMPSDSSMNMPTPPSPSASSPPNTGTADPTAQTPSPSSSGAVPPLTSGTSSAQPSGTQPSGTNMLNADATNSPGANSTASGGASHTGSSTSSGSTLSVPSSSPTDTSNPTPSTGSNSTASSGGPPTSSGPTLSGPSSSPTDTSDPASPTASNGTHSSGAHTPSMNMPGPPSSSADHPASSASSGGQYKHRPHRPPHHGWHHHGHHGNRSASGEEGGERRAWGAQHRRSAGKRHA